MENRILPDTSVVVAFRLKGIASDRAQPGDQRLPNFVFSGLRKQPRIIHYEPDSATLLINFKEGGAPVFFDIPMHCFFGQNVSLEDFIPLRDLQEISEKLDAATTDLSRIAVLEQYLLCKLNERKVDRLILAGVQQIKQHKGDIKIGELTRDLNISKDPFEKRFRQAIGATPKQFAKIIRLSTSIANYTGIKSLTELSLEAGYYDQSHYIRDFKLFTGKTPFQFFRSPALK